MRKLIVAAATAATLGSLGLTATAQAQPAAHTAKAGPAKTVVAGIPSGFTVAAASSASACTWKVTGQPKSVTAGPGGTNNCTNLIDGIWTKPGTNTITAKVTRGGSTTTITVTVTVKNSPGENDAVGVGSDTIQNVFDAFSIDFNSTASASAEHLYSWDATNPLNGQIGDSIPIKTDCSPIPRPDGSSAGISQLTTFTKSSSGPFCTNYARSSRARGASDPPFAPGGIAFVNLAGDAVTWSAQKTTNAPANLTTAQLAAIYNCTDTNWHQVGGKNAPIHAFIPQAGSGTRSFFLTAIGVANPGACVSDAGGTLEENEGVNPVLNDPNAIFPYSVGKYIAEANHSNKCANSACTPNASGITCTHTPGNNLFGCDTHGTMVLKKINGTAPTTGTGKNTKINPNFTATFQRTVFEVVPFDPATSDHIPGATSPVGGVNLEKLFGASGFVCKSTGPAHTDLLNYGFLPIPTCGLTS